MAREDFGYWRNRCREIIRQVLDATEGQPESTIRFALQQAYPFGERRYHPYKMWLKEIKCQRAKRAKPEPACMPLFGDTEEKTS